MKMDEAVALVKMIEEARELGIAQFKEPEIIVVVEETLLKKAISTDKEAREIFEALRTAVQAEMEKELPISRLEVIAGPSSKEDE